MHKTSTGASTTYSPRVRGSGCRSRRGNSCGGGCAVTCCYRWSSVARACRAMDARPPLPQPTARCAFAASAAPSAAASPLDTSSIRRSRGQRRTGSNHVAICEHERSQIAGADPEDGSSMRGYFCHTCGLLHTVGLRRCSGTSRLLRKGAVTVHAGCAKIGELLGPVVWVRPSTASSSDGPQRPGTVDCARRFDGQVGPTMLPSAISAEDWFEMKNETAKPFR